jgi:hypothetical protein
MNFDIVAYIKPNHDFDTFKQSLANIQKSKYINKIYISFVEKLNSKFINELNRYKNIIWKDGVDIFWAKEILSLVNKSNSECIYTWEEDSFIYNIDQFDKTFKNFVINDVDHMLTLDKKWIDRGKFLLNRNLAVQQDEFIYFNWGTYYAKYCRENSNNSTVNGAYPVTVGSMFSKKLLISLLNSLLESTYWTDITNGNFNHFHQNPKLPHSFEVFPGFWWPGKNNGYGNISYSTVVSTVQFAQELGGRLINKINTCKRDTINIVGYNDWYTQKPWCREEINVNDFNVIYDQNKSDITYYIKDGIYKINDNIDSNINIALLTECRLMDPVRYKFIEDNHERFDYIVTYDDQLIDKFKEKVIITPYGGTWIWPIEKQTIYNKNKICSYICSNKNFTKDQIMRINILNYFYQNPHSNIELFGRGHNPLPENHDDGDYDGKIVALKDFAFSLVIENHIQNNYFSEKLLDCLLTGTVPIYHGCKKISEYFNVDGFILFKNENEVKDIIKNLNMEDYNKRKNAIKENFKLAKNYRDSVQYSFQKLKGFKNGVSNIK